MSSKSLFWKIWYYILDYYDYEQIPNELKLDLNIILVLSVKDIYEYQIMLVSPNGEFELDDVNVLLNDDSKSSWYWNNLALAGIFKENFIIS